MEAAITPMMQKHYPVLLNEIISIISPQYGGTFIDCTFGYGGFSNAILSYPKTKVIAIDRDIQTKKYAEKIKKIYDTWVFSRDTKSVNPNWQLVDILT